MIALVRVGDAAAGEKGAPEKGGAAAVPFQHAQIDVQGQPGLLPEGGEIVRIFSPSVMRKLRLPRALSGGRWSKSSSKARRKSLGSRWARAGLAVMMRISRAEKVWQQSRMP